MFSQVQESQVHVACVALFADRSTSATGQIDSKSVAVDLFSSEAFGDEFIGCKFKS
jgi:hypothetical protein